MADEAKLPSSICLSFDKPTSCWLCDMHSGVVMEKNWALSVDQCQLEALQVLVNLIDLLSISLKCNCFMRIQTVVVDQTISRLPTSDHDLLLMQVWHWVVF